MWLRASLSVYVKHVCVCTQSVYCVCQGLILCRIKVLREKDVLATRADTCIETHAQRYVHTNECLVIQLVSFPSDTKWRPGAPAWDISGLRANQIAYTQSHACMRHTTHSHMRALRLSFNTLSVSQSDHNQNGLDLEIKKKGNRHTGKYFKLFL